MHAHLLLGNKKRASDTNLEVDLHDGEDGGIVMDVHRRHRGNVKGQIFHSQCFFSVSNHLISFYLQIIIINCCK